MDSQVTVPITAKPFLRWAGGKSWLLKNIHQYIPKEGYRSYHELFLGGGAMFFHLSPTEISYLSDINKDLIDTYNALKQNPHAIIKYLKTFKNTKSFYYELRSRNFSSKYAKAAQFIFLNQTSFNGIYRVNKNGDYNVPFGYRKGQRVDFANLINASTKLKNAIITCQDFDSALKNIKEGDLVFLDPPYTVSHNNNGFVQYNQHLFSIEDQIRLSSAINAINQTGAHYILTNAAHNKIYEIFHSTHSFFYKIKRASLIGGKNANRGLFEEYIITNCSP